MEKILYCQNKQSKRKITLPFAFRKTSNLKDVLKKEYPLVVFEDDFLKKRKKIGFLPLADKVCFINFSKENNDNLKIIEKLGFFGYLTDQDTDNLVAFKLRQAAKVWELKRRIVNLEHHILEKNKRIKKITLVDPLTDCYNWRYFFRRASQELSRARRHLHTICFLAINIDNFHQINEIYGLDVADSIIKEFAVVLGNSLRKEDVLIRWSDDDFFVIAPYQEDRYLNSIVRRLHKKLSFYKYKYKNLALTLKINLGAVSFPENNIFSIRGIVNALNECISLAKQKGGNRIVLYSQLQSRYISRRKIKATRDSLKSKAEKMNLLLNRSFLEMIYGFARTIEAKDYYTGKHVEYAAILAEKIAKSLKLPGNAIENIRHAAVLHDLGKVGIDESILSKKGPLNKKELNIIKTHPSIAAEILRDIHALRGAIPAILYHHESYDGKGYPLGLKGEDIPLSARIVGLADVYQALISDRPYRKALSKKKALEIIKNESGKHFDPKIVEAFLKVVDKLDEKE